MRNLDNTKRAMSEPFNWEALADEDVSPCIRGNIVILGMDIDREPLDLEYLQALTTRLQEGLNRMQEIERKRNDV